MKRLLKCVITLLSGAAYGLLVILLSRWLIQNLGTLAVYIGDIAGIDNEIIAQLAAALGQLADAELVSPWPAFLAVGAVFPLLIAPPRRSGKNRTPLLIVLGILLFIPLVLAALCFTEVNGVYAGALLRSLLPLLPSLL